MASKVTNNAATTLAGGINTVVTTINLAAGTGTLFPILSAGDWFYGTLVDASNNIEIVKVTARATDALTVVRGQDGTTARTYSVGDRFELRPTAALFNDKADLVSPSFTTKITTPAITLGATALTATGAELNYASGVTSAIQTQINAKAPTASPTFTGTATIPAISGAVNMTGAVLSGQLPLVFDGATANSFKTTLYITDPTANRTITVPNADVDLTKVRQADTSNDGVSFRALVSEGQAGTDTTKHVTPYILGNTVIGIGQAYNDVSASRASGVTYTNSTGRTIVVSTWSTTGGITNMIANAFVNGVQIVSNSLYSNGPGYSAFAYFLVPPGATYRVDFGNAGVTTKWLELR